MVGAVRESGVGLRGLFGGVSVVSVLSVTDSNCFGWVALCGFAMAAAWCVFRYVTHPMAPRG